MSGITEDQERELRIRVMQADLSLKSKQGFWETPRNIAILVTAVAAVAGLLGFKLGQTQQPPTTIIVQQPVPGK